MRFGGGGGGGAKNISVIEWIGREGSLSNAVGLFCILCYQVEYISFSFSFLIPYCLNCWIPVDPIILV